MYPCTKFPLISRTSDFGTKFVQKNMHDRNFGKNNHYIQNKDIAMYAFIKFQSIWKTSVLGTKFAQETL